MNLITAWGSFVGSWKGRKRKEQNWKKGKKSKMRAVGDGTAEQIFSLEAKKLKIKSKDGGPWVDGSVG